MGDGILALLGSGILCPLGCALWLLVTLTSSGHALLCQPRLGQAGRRFSLLKFRSMEVPGGRVTSLGRWLRATALDELPQLVNILRGDMSFVGPRPLLADDAASIAAIPESHLRATVRPGLAGLAQLYAGKHPDPAARMALDLGYVRHGGFWLDVWILCCAVATSLRGGWEPAGRRRAIA